MKKIFAPCIIAGALCAAAGAQAADTSRFYLSADAGRSQFKLDEGGLGARFQFAGRGVDFSHEDKKDSTYAIHAGYQITPNLALEAGYADLGEASYTAKAKPCPQTQCFSDMYPATLGKLSASAWDIAAVGSIKLAEKWYGYGKAGLSGMRVKSENSTRSPLPILEPQTAAASAHTTNYLVPKLALGAGYQLTPAVSLQLEWSHYFKGQKETRYSRASINTATAGVKVNF